VLFGWSLEGEDGLFVFAGDGEVALGDDVYFRPSAKVPMTKS